MRFDSVRPGSFALAAVVLSCLLVGCSGHAEVDKLGRPTKAVLTIGAAEPEDPDLAYFVHAVERESGGSVAVTIDHVSYFSETPDAEEHLAGDVREGRVAAAYVPTQDWAAVDPEWEAVQAPLLMTTSAASVAFARSDVAASMLHDTGDAGVVALAVIPGEAHRLLSREPVTTLADLQGLRIRSSQSAQADRILTALGAVPVHERPGAQPRYAFLEGRIDAAETSPWYAQVKNFNAPAPYISGFGLFPRTSLILVSAATWNALGPAEHGALRRAAADALSHAAKDVPDQEAQSLAQMCSSGAVVVQPAPKALATLARAVSQHAGDPTTRANPAATALVPRISDVVGSEGIQATSPVPDSCPVAHSAPEARALLQDHDATEPTTSGGFPVGTYTFRVSKEAWAAGGISGNPDFQTDITYWQTFLSDGTWSEVQEPDFPDQGPMFGRWTTQGDRLIATLDPSFGMSREVVQWSYYRGVLSLKPINVQDRGSKVIYQQPWRRVG